MRITAALSAAAIAGLLAGCANGAGPLEVPSGNAVCAPAPGEGTKYFGMPLENTGSDDLTLTGADWDGDGVEAVAFLVDTEAGALDQFVGTMAWPTEQPLGYEEDILERAVPVKGAVIPAGVTADLLVAVEPASATDDAVVTETRISYEVGLGYTATSGMTMTLAAATC